MAQYGGSNLDTLGFYWPKNKCQLCSFSQRQFGKWTLTLLNICEKRVNYCKNMARKQTTVIADIGLHKQSQAWETYQASTSSSEYSTSGILSPLRPETRVRVNSYMIWYNRYYSTTSIVVYSIFLSLVLRRILTKWHNLCTCLYLFVKYCNVC